MVQVLPSLSKLIIILKNHFIRIVYIYQNFSKECSCKEEKYFLFISFYISNDHQALRIPTIAFFSSINLYIEVLKLIDIIRFSG